MKLISFKCQNTYRNYPGVN